MPKCPRPLRLAPRQALAPTPSPAWPLPGCSQRPGGPLPPGLQVPGVSHHLLLHPPPRLCTPSLAGLPAPPGSPPSWLDTWTPRGHLRLTRGAQLCRATNGRLRSGQMAVTYLPGCEPLRAGIARPVVTRQQRWALGEALADAGLRSLSLPSSQPLTTPTLCSLNWAGFPGP